MGVFTGASGQSALDGGFNYPDQALGHEQDRANKDQSDDDQVMLGQTADNRFQQRQQRRAVKRAHKGANTAYAENGAFWYNLPGDSAGFAASEDVSLDKVCPLSLRTLLIMGAATRFAEDVSEISSTACGL